MKLEILSTRPLRGEMHTLGVQLGSLAKLTKSAMLLAAGFYGLRCRISNKIHSETPEYPFVPCIDIIENIINLI